MIKHGKYLKIKNILEEIGLENIEHKKDVSHRINKTDIVITLDFKDQFEDYKKINNLIVITDNTNKNYIWNIVNKLNIKDIIFKKENEEYIATRIKNVI